MAISSLIPGRSENVVPFPVAAVFRPLEKRLEAIGTDERTALEERWRNAFMATMVGLAEVSMTGGKEGCLPVNLLPQTVIEGLSVMHKIALQVSAQVRHT